MFEHFFDVPSLKSNWPKKETEMELTQAEVKSVEQAVNAADEQQFCALTELQLAFVGGGIGDTAI